MVRAMHSMLATLLFWIVVLMTVTAATFVVVARNILHAAFALAVAFLGVAGIYIFLHADFLAAVQLIVYVGGIIVLVMFAIMFSAHTQEGTVEPRRTWLALGGGALVAGVVLAATIMLINRLQVPLAEANAHADAAYRTTASAAPGEIALGHVLLGEYLLPFEVASILILAALVGAVAIVRKETR